MLTKDQKKQLVKDITEEVKAAKSAVFVDYRGLKVNDLTQLKKNLREKGCGFRVAKKTLIERALKEAGIVLDVKSMEGQIAITVSPDEVTGAKTINDFGKKNENIKILKGILESNVLEAEEVKALANLPSREEMLVRLVGTLNAPISGFVNVLAGNIRGLVQVLKAIGGHQA